MAIPYLGSKISLITNSEIRYEGVLYTIDTKESTIALAKVRSFGTEDRPTDRPVIPRDEVFEYIVFRGTDIKDIRVCQPPKPQPTLEGGLPHDPAIVQHSAGSASSAPAVTLGSTHGTGASHSVSKSPVFSSNVLGGAPAAAPFSTLPGGAVPHGRLNEASPVMDLLRNDARSGASSPTARTSSRPASGAAGVRSPHNYEGGQRRGSGRGSRGFDRGMAPGFQRGGRGRGGMYHRGQRPHYPPGRFTGNRGDGAHTGRPTTNKKESLKFDDDYDFEQANEQFQEFLSKFEKASLEGKEVTKNGEPQEEQHDEGEVNEESDPDKSGPCYDKQKSFFDNISCEALERSKGNLSRPDWKAEKKLNRETFGATGNYGAGYRGNRGGYYSGRGGYNRGRGGAYNKPGGYSGYNGYGGYNSGRFSRENAGTGYYRGRGGQSQRGMTGGQWQRGRPWGAFNRQY